MLKSLKEEINAIIERDPAAKSFWEVLLTYPGLHAVMIYRVAHWFYSKRRYIVARMFSHLARFFTGIEIHPGAKIGKRIFIDHGMGVVIGETVEIGNDVTIYQGATLGGTGKETGKRHPDIGDNVVISSGAKVLGPFKIGNNSKVGAGAVVLREVPPNCTVVGVPGRIAFKSYSKLKSLKDIIDLDQVKMPDPIAQELECLQKRVNKLEKIMNEMEVRRENETLQHFNQKEGNL